MLDCGDGNTGVIADNGTKGEIFDVSYVSRDVSDHSAAFGNNKAKTGIGFCRMQDDRYRRPAMHPRASEFDLARNRRLSCADESIRHVVQSLDAFPRQTATTAPADLPPLAIVRRSRLRGSYCVPPSHR